jgi:hypothetical protein
MNGKEDIRSPISFVMFRFGIPSGEYRGAGLQLRRNATERRNDVPPVSDFNFDLVSGR